MRYTVSTRQRDSRTDVFQNSSGTLLTISGSCTITFNTPKKKFLSRSLYRIQQQKKKRRSKMTMKSTRFNPTKKVFPYAVYYYCLVLSILALPAVRGASVSLVLLDDTWVEQPISHCQWGRTDCTLLLCFSLHRDKRPWYLGYKQKIVIRLISQIVFFSVSNR